MQPGAIILCGGRSSRMGLDKATLPFGAELMLQRVVRIVSEVIELSAIVVVAAPDQILPELPATVTIARDEYLDRGPLEGLAAGFRAMRKHVEAVYVTSCDAPLLVPNFIHKMLNCLDEYDIAVPYDGQFYHPLAAVLRPCVLSTVESMLATDRLRIASLFDEVSTLKVLVESLRNVDPTLSSLLNCNHPEDYLSALKSAGFSPVKSMCEATRNAPRSAM